MFYLKNAQKIVTVIKKKKSAFDSFYLPDKNTKR